MTDFAAALPEQPAALDKIIALHEKAAKPLKKDAEARIIWHNEQHKSKTPWSIVYLHGFKGSQGEGYPVHRTIAQTFGCNLYLARLHGHGLIRKHNLGDLSSEDLLQSAMEACRIGEKIGGNVIVMGTSTGASLALYAAASNRFSNIIKALVLYSPLVHLYGINSLLLENSIGRTALRFIPGKNHQIKYDPFSPEEEAIWYSSYLLNGALVLGETVQKIMRSSLFAQVQCPVFTGYYYKNSLHHDRVVSTSAIKRMMQKLGTVSSKKLLVNFPNAGSHVIANSLLSNAVQDVIRETSSFLERNAFYS